MSALVSERPTSRQPGAYDFPEVTRGRLDNGLQVLPATMPRQPLVSAALVGLGGVPAESLPQAGVTALMARLVLSGPEGMGPLDFAIATERLGATLRADVDFDSFRWGFDCAPGSFSAVLGMLADAVRRPAFRRTELARVRGELVDGIAQAMAVAPLLAARTFPSELFAPASRLALPVQGSAESMAVLTDDDVRGHFDAVAGPAASALVVTGPLHHEEVMRAACQVFADWQGSAVRPPVARDELGAREARTVLVDRPGSAQSALVIGHPGPARSMPDWVAATTMAACLGGLFGSRLNYRLREQNGFTYGAFAGFETRRGGGTFAARCAVHTAVTAPAVEQTVEVIASMLDGVAQAELDDVRRFRSGVFPVSFESAGAVCGAVTDLVVHDLPVDYHRTIRDQLAEVTVAEVDEAARRHLQPDQLIAVVVGDAGLVQDALADVGPGPIVVR
jgi:predicted Zn-dependent peptidase